MTNGGMISFFLILWLNNIKGEDMNGRELGFERFNFLLL
jgi:hypothetical protein